VHGRCFLLQAAAVCQHDVGVLPEEKRFPETQWWQQVDPCRKTDVELGHHLARPGVDGKKDGLFGGNFIQSRCDSLERIPLIHVGGAMEREKAEGGALSLECRRGEPAVVLLFQKTDLVKQVVDHHVAHHVNSLHGLSLGKQIPLAALLGHEEAIRDRVRHHAIDLFGHRRVEAAQARFDVSHPDEEFLGNDAAGKRRVHVSHHDDPVRHFPLTDLFEGCHDLCRLDGM